ncbi:hypothetical protein H8A97_03535 [Bradyrhizobium sp. Arg62]|uniref:hypothetical protein n=1 Tax=Bradyrhizobium brasilense TaxID=1419277 RepID=UPI001E5751E1|nr:hypothetical protein [Bradyrhizobium brasilense]MCC8944195.1 hypothetical protein [Bradyrhizobium brasilense]
MPVKPTPAHNLAPRSISRLDALDQASPRSCAFQNSIESSPLAWWRTRLPQDLDRQDVKRIRALLLRAEPINDCDWLRAATGDSAAAIGVAIRVLKFHGMTDSLTDVAMSAVLCCFLEDDGASTALIRSALRRRRKIDRRSHDLWLHWRNDPF